MNNNKYLFLCVMIPLVISMFGLPASDAAADSLDTLIASAIEADSTLQSLRLALEEKLTDAEIAEARDGFSLSLSGAAGGLPSVSYAASGVPSTFSVEFGPSFSGRVGNVSGTTYSLNVPMSIDDGELDVSVRAGVTQPLNRLFGWAPDTAEQLVEQSGIAKAQSDIAAREIAVGLEVLSLVKTLYSLEAQRFTLEGAISDLMVDLENQRTLFQFNEESYTFRKLEFDLMEKEDELISVEAAIERQSTALSEKLGGQEADLPATLPEVEIVLPETADSAENADVAAALRSLAIEEEQLREQPYQSKPDLSLSPSVNIDPLDIANGLSISLALEVKMDIIDGGASKLELEKGAISVAQARIALDDAERAYRDDLLDLALEVKEYEARAKRFPIELELADLRVSETRVSFDNGFISGTELQAVEREREKLDFDQLLLQIDGHLLMHEVMTLTALRY